MGGEAHSGHGASDCAGHRLVMRRQRCEAHQRAVCQVPLCPPTAFTPLLVLNRIMYLDVNAHQHL